MADPKAYFYNSVSGDRVYDADSMTDWLKPFFVTGVFNGDLQVTANGDMTVSVAAGYTNVEGKVKHFTQAQTLTLETASGTLNRIDTVVIRRDDTGRDIGVMIITGGYASKPVATEPVRSGAYYDLVIAQIYVAAGTVKITQNVITDTRADTTLCGWVTGTVKEIDFAQITAQFESFFQKYQGDIQTTYNDYVSSVQNLEDKGSAAYTALQKDFEDYKAQQQATFTAWFDTMKGQLSTDAAGNLQNQITALQSKVGNAITDLSTKLTFTKVTKATTEIDITITNTDTGTVTTYAYKDGGKVYLTEPGNYSLTDATGTYTILPKTFKLDHTQTTETLAFSIYDKNAYAVIGAYVGSYISKNS